MFTEKDFIELIPDQGIRNYIAEGVGLLGQSPFSATDKFYRLMHNTVNLAFMYAFSCYVDLRNRNQAIDIEHNGTSNSNRVFRTFAKIYSEHPVRVELIQFILLDIQFDFFLADDSRLRTFFPDCVSTNSSILLSEFFNIINLGINSSRFDEYSLEDLGNYFRELIRMFPFLSRSKLEFSPETGWYVFRLRSSKQYRYFPDHSVYTYGLIHRFKSGKREQFYYLTSIDKETTRYECFRDSKICQLPAVFEEEGTPVIAPPYKLPWDNESMYTYLNPKLFHQNIVKDETKAISYLYNINYKYLKNLALAIADALGRDVYKDYLQELIRISQKMYPAVFDNYTDYNANTDSIILMLLIEASPSIVLQTMFKVCPRIAYPVLKNLCNRLGSEFAEKFSDIQSNEDFDDRACRLIDNHYTGTDLRVLTENKAWEELLVEAKAAIILSELSCSAQLKGDYSISAQVGQNLKALEDIKNIDESADGKKTTCELIRNALVPVLKRITCFYAGVFAYGKIKLEYDKRSELRLPSPDTIKEYQDGCIREFIRAAQEKYREMKDVTSVKTLIEMFVALCSQCSDASSNNLFGRSSESRYLYTVLGKYRIMDIDVFKQKIDIENVEDLSESLSSDKIDWWLKKGIMLIRFLAIGSYEIPQRKDKDPASYFRRAIAPIPASYFRINNGIDGYEPATFILTIDDTGDEVADYRHEINVLSEFTYDMNLKYYCLPNILRSNEKWWIDPLIIECKLLDDILKE